MRGQLVAKGPVLFCPTDMKRHSSFSRVRDGQAKTPPPEEEIKSTKITAQLPQEIPVACSWCTGFTLKVEGKVTVETSLTAQPKSLLMDVGPSVTSPVADNICPANGVLNRDVMEGNKAANPLFITMIQGGFLPFH